MKNKRRFLGLAFAAILAIAGTVSLVSYVQSARTDAVADETLVDVYVVDQLVPQGARADAIGAAVSLERVPARLVQPGAIDDLADVGDLVAATDLQPGDQLLSARLVESAEVVDQVSDKVEVALVLTAERAVGGALEPGDTVGVYLSFDPFRLNNLGNELDAPPPPETSEVATDVDAVIRPDVDDSPAATDDDEASARDETDSTDAAVATIPSDAESPNVTRLEFQHVLVTNVQTTTTPVEQVETDGETATVSQVTGTQFIVTLALSPEESERLVFAAEFGHVWLANEPATVSDDGTRLVTLGNVYEVEQS